MRTKSIGLVVLAGLLALAPLTATPARAATRSLVQGSGSSWPANLVNLWILSLDVEGVKVVYAPTGSDQGRRDFAQGSVDFGVSDRPFLGTDELGEPDTADGREVAYVPIAAGATAFPYRLEVEGRLVRDLRLSGATLAGIFTGAITSWADPAITADNNGRVLPDLPVVPVVRADGNGSTAQLTAWLDDRHPEVWRPHLGRSGSTSYFPVTGSMLARSGSAGLMNAVDGTNGAIGYVESSASALGRMPVAKVRNSAGLFVAPTGPHAAIALRAATVDDDGRPVLDGVYANPDPRAYPIPSLALLLLPTGAADPRISAAKRQSLAELVHHGLCTGQADVGQLGFAPLPRALVEPSLAQLARLKQADPAVDLTGLDLASCTGNPTFDPADPDLDLLDETVPLPPACDRPVSGPCGSLSEVHPWPVVAGTPEVGATLWARPGPWSGPGPYDRQWLVDGRPLPGATAATYVVPASLVGRELSVRVTTHGVPAVAEDTTAPTTIQPGRLSLALPRITGRPVVGRRLAVRPVTTRGARVAVRWYADGRVVPRATGTSLRLGKRMRGQRIVVLVVAWRPGYTTVARTSKATRPVTRTSRRG